MRRLTAVSLIAAAALLAGCATTFPQNAEEFRRAVPTTRFLETQTFEVGRSFNDVAQTFKRRAAECLNVTVRTTSRTQTSYQVIDTEYKPTVVVTKQRAELHVQQHHTKGVIYPGEVPPGGPYVLVADAYPVAAQRTRVQMFVPTIGHKPLIEAVKGWATGKNLGCPDLTKT